MRLLIIIFSLLVSAQELPTIYVYPPAEWETLFEKADQDSAVHWSPPADGTELRQISAGLAGTYSLTTGGEGSLSTLSVRGLGASHTLVLFEGFRLNLPQGGGYDLSLIPSFALGEGDLHYGGMAGLFGPGDSGGVLSLQLFSPQKSQQGGASLSYGTDHMGKLAVRQGWLGREGEWVIAAGGALGKGDYVYFDHDNRQNRRRRNNHLEQSFLAARSIWAPSADRNLRTILLWGRQRHQVPGATLFGSEQAYQDSGQFLLGSHYSQRLSSKMSFQISPSLHYSNLGFENRDFSSASSMETWEPELRAIFNWNQTPFSISGVSSLRHLILDGNIFSASRTEGNLGEIIFYQRGSWQIGEGASLVMTKGGPNYISMRNMVQYSRKRWKIFARAGRSGRFPDFNEIYWPEEKFAMGDGIHVTSGNRDLRPESVWQWEGGAEVESNMGGSLISLRGTYFENWGHDLIQWEEKNFIFKPENIAQSVVRGFMGELEGDFSFLSWRINHSFVDARDRQLHKALPFQPRYRMGGEISMSLGSVQWMPRFHYQSSSFVASSNEKKIPSSWDFDIGVRAPLIKNQKKGLRGESLWGGPLWWELWIRNLLNHSREIVEGYPLPGRLVSLTLGTSW